VIHVLDASALLAAYQREPGWERVERDLDEAFIGTVNLSEAAETGRAWPASTMPCAPMSCRQL
jgi:PIN domain nuclease of toxin-antitoxin system